MTLTYTYNGSALGFGIPPTKALLPQRAEVGAVSQGGVSPEDPTAALTLVGWKSFVVEESACSQPRLFTGWVGDRGIGRSFDQAQLVGPDARIYDTTILDLNACFRMRIITGTDSKRPQESVDARIAWILSSNYLNGTSGTLVADTGFVATGFSALMDETDYYGGYPEDVFVDCAGRYATPINWFAFWDPVAAASSMFFDYVGAATYECTISISNLVADTYTGDTPSTTCFAPITESKLDRTGETVYSDVIVDYKNGSVHRTMPSTAAAAIRRGTRISRPYIGKRATAEMAGNAFLAAHAVETDRVTTTIRVPRTVVGLIQAGMRMPVKYTHFEGQSVAPDLYRNGTSMRIVACTPRAINDYARFYDVDLELVGPRVPPTAALNARLYWQHSGFYGCESVAHYGDGAEVVGWEFDGDNPRTGLDGSATTGAAEFVPYSVAGTACKWDGIRILADATVDIYMGGRFGGVASEAGSSIKVDVRRNGTIIHTETQTDPSPAVHFWGGEFVFDPASIAALNDVELSAEDVITVSVTFSNWAGFEYFAAIPSDTSYYATLWITGTGAFDQTLPGVELPGDTTEATTDPTVDDDADAGYTVGMIWVNTATGEAFLLVDATPGAAVWVSISQPTNIGGVEISGTPAADYLIIGSSSTAAAWGPHPVHAHSGLSGLTTGDDHPQYLRRIEVRRGPDKAAGITPTGYCTTAQTWSDLANTTDGNLATAAVLSASVLGAGTYYAGFQFDLGSPTTLSMVSVLLAHGGADPGGATNRWGNTVRIRSSDDGASWTTLDTVTPVWAYVDAVAGGRYRATFAHLSIAARYLEVALVLVWPGSSYDGGPSVYDVQWMEAVSAEHALLSDSHRDVDTSAAPVVGDALVWDGTKYAPAQAGGRRTFTFFGS